MDTHIAKLIVDNKEKIAELMQFYLVEHLYFYSSDNERFIQNFVNEGVNIFFTTHKMASVVDRLIFRHHILAIFKNANVSAATFTLIDLVQLFHRSQLGETPDKNLQNYYYITEHMNEFQNLISN